MKNSKLFGLVLCGGMSRRMGQDKGLIKNAQNLTWVEEACQRIRPYIEKGFISIRKEQEPFYHPYRKDFEFIFDDEETGIEGPARGLVSAHLSNRSRDWLVNASDMPNLPREAILRAVNAYERDPSFDAYLFYPGGKPEPLVGIYTSAALEKLLEKFTFTKNYSLALHLGPMNVFKVESSDLDSNDFMSQNFPEG